MTQIQRNMNNRNPLLSSSSLYRGASPTLPSKATFRYAMSLACRVFMARSYAIICFIDRLFKECLPVLTSYAILVEGSKKSGWLEGAPLLTKAWCRSSCIPRGNNHLRATPIPYLPTALRPLARITHSKGSLNAEQSTTMSLRKNDAVLFTGD